MAALNLFNQFKEDLAKGVHNLDTDAIKVMLVNSPAPVATNSVKADLTEISAGNGYTAGGSALVNQDAEQTGGVLALISDKVRFTASGGSITTFRYAVFYNDTPTSPADPLIGWVDYGTNVTITDGNHFDVRPESADTGGDVLTIT